MIKTYLRTYTNHAGSKWEVYSLGYVSGIVYHGLEWLVRTDGKELQTHGENFKFFKTIEKAQVSANNFAKNWECPPVAREFFLEKLIYSKFREKRKKT